MSFLIYSVFFRESCHGPRNFSRFIIETNKTESKRPQTVSRLKRVSERLQ